MKKVVVPVIIASLFVAAYYFIFSKEEWEERDYTKEKDTASALKTLDEITEEQIQKEIFYTLPERVIKPKYGGKVFCTNKLFGYEKDTENIHLNIYLYAKCEEYFLKDETVNFGYGISQPLLMTYVSGNNAIELKTITAPETNEDYEDFINDNFPEKYWEDALHDTDMAELNPTPKTQAENYYSGRLEVYF